MFAEMLRCGDVMATFIGHDHINDYAVAMKGILFAYGRYTGGKTVYCDIPGGNGARVIEMTQGRRGFDSWIRLADGSVINRIDFPHDFTDPDVRQHPRPNRRLLPTVFLHGTDFLRMFAL